MIGWYVYYINRYRKSDVQLGDITTLIGVLGGGTATALFSPGGELFGAYGIRLFVGFFGYFVSLIYLVDRSANFDADWFLDGRRKHPAEPYYIPGDAVVQHPMAIQPIVPPAPAAPSAPAHELAPPVIGSAPRSALDVWKSPPAPVAAIVSDPMRRFCGDPIHSRSY